MSERDVANGTAGDCSGDLSGSARRSTGKARRVSSPPSSFSIAFPSPPPPSPPPPVTSGPRTLFRDAKLPPQLESHVLGFLAISSVALAWRVSRRLRRAVAVYLRGAAVISFARPPIKCDEQFRAARLLVELHCVALRELVVAHAHSCEHATTDGACSGPTLRRALIELVQRNGATLARVQAPTSTGCVYRATSVALAIVRACPRLREPFYTRRLPPAPTVRAAVAVRTPNDDIQSGEVFCFRQLARAYSRHTITEIALAETGALLPGVEARATTQAMPAAEVSARLDVIVDTGEAIAAYLRESGGGLARLTLRVASLPTDAAFGFGLGAAGSRLVALDLDFQRGFRTREQSDAALRSLPYVDACRQVARACAQLGALRRLNVAFDAYFAAPLLPGDGAAERCRDALALTHDLEWRLPQLERFRAAVGGRGWYALPLVVAPRLRTVYARGFTIDSVGRLLAADRARHLVAFECECTERDPARETTGDGDGRTAASWEAILNGPDDGDAKSRGGSYRSSSSSSSRSPLRVLHIDSGFEKHTVATTRVGPRDDQLQRLTRRFPHLRSLAVRPAEARTEAASLLAILRRCPRLQWCELSGFGYCVSARQLLVQELIERHVADNDDDDETATPVSTERAIEVEGEGGGASPSSPSPSSSSAPLVFTHSHLVALFLDDVDVEFWRGVRLPRVARTHQSTYRHDFAPVFAACPSVTSFSAFSGAGWQCAEPSDNEAMLRLARATFLAAETQIQPAALLPSLSPLLSSSSSTSAGEATKRVSEATKRVSEATKRVSEAVQRVSEAAPRASPFRAPNHFLYLDRLALAALPQALAWFPHLRTLMLPRTAPTWAISALAALLPRLPALLKIDMAHNLDADRLQARAPEAPEGDDALRRAAAVEAYSDLGAAAVACGSRLAEIALSPLQSREHSDAVARAVCAALPAWTVKWTFV